MSKYSDQAAEIKTALDTVYQEKSNIKTSTTGWSSTLTDTKYPSEKLVKEYIDNLIGQAINYINE